MLLSVAPGSPPGDPVRGLVPCFSPPRLLQSGEAPVRCTWFTPGRSSPGAGAVLLSAPVAPIRGVIFNVFSLLPRMLQSVAPGSPPDDPVRGLGPCSTLPRLLQPGVSFCRNLSVASDALVRGTGFSPGRSSPGASAVLHSAPYAPIRGVFYRILSVASDAPVRGTGFSPGRSSPGAGAVLHSAPVAPIRGVFLSYSLRCLGCSSPLHRVLPRTIQSGGFGRAPLRPGCSNPGCLFVVISPLPQTPQSAALGSAPDDPVRGLVPCFIPPRLLQSGASF